MNEFPPVSNLHLNRSYEPCVLLCALLVKTIIINENGIVWKKSRCAENFRIIIASVILIMINSLLQNIFKDYKVLLKTAGNVES